MVQAKPLHLIPFCRYWLGLKNFFDIFAPIVDSWMFFDNTNESILLANEDKIVNPETFNKIKSVCQKKKSKN